MNTYMSNNTAVEIKNLTVAYGGDPVLWNINTTIENGRITAVMGPNGAGKTTLLKSILGLIRPITGQTEFNLPENKKGCIAYVPQSENIDWDFPATVSEVVLMGRYAKLGWLKRPKKEDKAICLQMLEKVGMSKFKDRHINQLSGGQKQRIFLARALAQQADIYFMDEPFKGVDIKTEKIIMTLLHELRAEGKTIIVVHHDLNTIEEYFDNILLINKCLVAQGSISDIFTEENITKTYKTSEVCL